MRALIMIESDSTEIRKMLEKLGNQKTAGQALQKALNETAKQARELLGNKAQETYTVKQAGFNETMKIKKATPGRLEASIRTEGEPLELTNFEVSDGGGTIRVRVLKSGGLKPLKKGRLTSFVNNVARAGQVRKKSSKKGKKGSAVRHYAVAQRLGKERLEIKTFYGNSIPVMLGNEKRVYGVTEPYITGHLQENLRKYISQALGG